MTSKNKHTVVTKINCGWVDSSYNNDRNINGKVAKRVTNNAMATHFAKMQQLDQCPTLQRNSQHNRCHEANLHNDNKLPLCWQAYIQDNINKLRETIPRYIEE